MYWYKRREMNAFRCPIKSSPCSERPYVSCLTSRRTILEATGLVFTVKSESELENSTVEMSWWKMFDTDWVIVAARRPAEQNPVALNPRRGDTDEKRRHVAVLFDSPVQQYYLIKLVIISVVEIIIEVPAALQVKTETHVWSSDLCSWVWINSIWLNFFPPKSQHVEENGPQNKEKLKNQRVTL